MKDDLLFVKGNRLFILKGKLRHKLLRKTQDAELAGHPGRERMMILLDGSYFWPKVEDDVEFYVKICLVCQQDMSNRKKQAGLLQPFPIPKKP